MRTLVFILITAHLANANAQLPNYVPTDGLVGWWPFNGNANDESGNGNNGVTYGPTLAIDRFGSVDHAYDFNGVADYIEVMDDASLDLVSELSISV